MATRVCGFLGVKFGLEIAWRSSRIFLGFRSHGPTGLKMGSLTMSFPVWRELKLSCSSIVPSPFISAYNVLSRLKGIETRPMQGTWWSLEWFLQCPFPFEGNWNLMSYENGAWISVRVLTMSFPVWRELKLGRSVRGFLCVSRPYNVLSRLKGIETRAMQATEFGAWT